MRNNSKVIYVSCTLGNPKNVSIRNKYKRKKTKKIHITLICLISEVIPGGARNVPHELLNRAELYISVPIFLKTNASLAYFLMKGPVY